MHNAHQPSDDELPSTRQLIRSTVVALAAAIVILITTVLPAEYAVDPTGIGRVLGLTQMGEIKIHASRAAVGQVAAVAGKTLSGLAPPAATGTPPGKSDEMSVILMPGKGTEVKVEMRKGKRVSYRWSTNVGLVYYDAHAEPYNAPKNFFHRYGNGRAPGGEGVLEAVFDGHHGWYWRNDTKKVLKVTLWVKGNYIKMKRLF
jgi:hypothetical protein